MSLTTETKVGLLVIAAAAGAAWLSWESGNIGPSQVASSQMRMLETEFDDVDGLTIGSKVKVAGVQVGEIANLYLNEYGTATISMAIRRDVALPANVKAQVATSGLIGEKFVALTTDFTPEGELGNSVIKIESIGKASVDDIAGDFSQITDDLKSVSSALRSALGGRQNADKLSRIVSSLETVGTRMEDLLVKELEPGKVNNIVNNLSDFSDKMSTDSGDMIADLRDAASAMKRILSSNEGEASELIANMSTAASNLAIITDKMAKGEGLLGKLLTEESTAIEDFEQAMKDIQEAANKVNSGEGTIGRLINDPSTVEKIEGALDGLASISGRMEQFRTEVSFQGYQLAAEDVAKGNFTVTLRPRPNRYYVLGVTSDGFATEADDTRTDTSFFGQDFGNEMKFTAQFGHVYEDTLFWGKDIGFRIGIKDSTFGIGTDVDFWDNFVQVSADVYDFSGQNSGNVAENPHLDITAKVKIIDRTIYAIGGVDNALNQEVASPFVGIGFRFQDDDLKFLAGQAL